MRVLFIRNLICIYFNINAAKSQVHPKSLLDEKVKDPPKTQLSIADVFKTKEDLQASRVFSEDILGQDGVLLLRFINMNIGPSSAAELAGMIWIKYRKTTASASRATSSGLDDFVFSNMAASESEGPPTIPPKRRRTAAQKRKKKHNFMPLNALIYRSKYCDDNDSDRSSTSSRPTIEMLQERKRYHPMVHRRGHYFSDDEDDDDNHMATVLESQGPEEFLDRHDSLETGIEQAQEESASEYHRSLND